MSNNPFQILQTTAFGELQVANATPVVQADAVYGIGEPMRTIVSGSSTATTSQSNYVCSTGTTTNSLSSIFTRKAVVYKPGQGAEVRFTAIFTEDAGENTRQEAGFQNATDGFVFGFEGNTFGVLRRHHGSQVIQELEITGAASGTENATVKINGTDYTVPLTAGTTAENAVEVADSLTAQVPLYVFQAVEEFVIVRSLIAAPASGAFSFTSSTATGTFTEVAAGVTPSRDFIPQTSWNGDNTDWLDPTLGNVYRISYQYLGYGVINFFVEDPQQGKFIPAHQLRYPNTSTLPHVANPTFRAGWTASNNADASDVVVKGASIGVFNQGNRIFTDTARTIRGDVNTNTTEIPVLSIQCREVFGEKVNLNPLVPEAIYGFTEGTRGAEIRIYKNATLTGALFSYVDKDNSIALEDTSATAFSGGTQVGSTTVSDSGSLPFDLRDYNLEVLPGETLTLTIQQLRGSAADCSGSLVYQEDI